MAKRRGSIPIMMSVALITVGMIGMAGAMTLQTSAAHHAGQERWHQTAEQAARSGLDFVLGWGEAKIDDATSLPRDWDMATDGSVIDPAAGYLLSRLTPPTVRAKASQVTAPGEILGQKVGEYVLSKTGNYLVTFKVRLQQYRITDDQPKRYRIGVIGRVRHINTANDPTVDTDESANIVSERMVMATLGQEPFAKYAVVNDIDFVGNWSSGEVVDGPVHINRGYVDSTDADRKANLAYSNGNFRNWRSRFTVNVASSTQYPIFKDLVTLTAINDGNRSGTFSDDNFSDYSTVVGLNGVMSPYGGISATTAQKIFQAPANQGLAIFGGKAGPLPVPEPLELPGTIREKLSSVMGVPTGNKIQDYPWFNGLEDGVYIPTKRVWDTTVGQAIDWSNRVPSTLTYGGNATDYPAGGVYIRGNVEGMRMTTSGKYSYYMIQLGYGGFDPRIRSESDVDNYYGPTTSGGNNNAQAVVEAGAVDLGPLNTTNKFFNNDTLDYVGDGMIPGSVHRVYMIRVDRTTRELWMRAFPQGTIDDLYDGAVANAKPDGASNLALFFDAPKKKKKKGKKGATGGGDITPITDASQFVVTGDDDVVAKLPAPPTSYSEFPFNGVFFVDLSVHDPARHLTDPESRAAGVMPLTGNILALGDPGHYFSDPYNKRKFGDYTQELVATDADASPSANARASRLTIMAAGSIFVQNHLYLEALRAMGNATNPTQQNFRLSHSHDSLGLVADRQILIGNSAPDNLVMHATIAALGDPAFDYATGTVKDADKDDADYMYRGSFGTEDLANVFENYGLISWSGPWPSNNAPFRDPLVMLGASPTPAPTAPPPGNAWRSDSAAPTGRTWDPIDFPLTYAKTTGGTATTHFTKTTYKTGVTWTCPSGRYPSNPLSMLYDALDNANPNSGSRGDILNFGSLVIKKRGSVATNGNGYSKDYRYDRRLQSIAPPLYPTSANVVLRIEKALSPTDGPYKGKGAGTDAELTFMGTDAPY